MMLQSEVRIILGLVGAVVQINFTVEHKFGLITPQDLPGKMRILLTFEKEPLAELYSSIRIVFIEVLHKSWDVAPPLLIFKLRWTLSLEIPVSCADRRDRRNVLRTAASSTVPVDDRGRPERFL
ncbi:unnamed protein product [Nippostrongylus brasiliensis]|uniref:Secreted protein n=1 Tax=Nippostrongylus brasiliensis TaxID=27835 RepID=A0A0N4Y1M7_NIPBR|nr:unnamed protein product [Nippostrongylus brasiliensis]